MRANVGADVDHGVAQLDVGAHRLDLEIAPLAVEVEAAPDEGVVAAVHEQTVAAVLDRDVAVLDQIGRLHGCALRGSSRNGAKDSRAPGASIRQRGAFPPHFGLADRAFPSALLPGTTKLAGQGRPSHL